jgi:hypothetical protein
LYVNSLLNGTNEGWQSGSSGRAPA